MSGRERFGPPQNPFGAFGWAVLQLPRALLWTVREKDLRHLVFIPALITTGVTLLLCGLALLLVRPLEHALVELPDGVLGSLAGFGLTVVLGAALLFAAILAGWQLSGPIAASSLERMALYVQREVTGDAPAPSIGGVAVVTRAVRGIFPSARRLVIWALTSIASLSLVLVPGVGPVLVLIAETAIGAIFLSHGAIADNRDRLGLPRRLLLREPALLLGYALACTPLVLFPLAMLFASGPVAVGGALVALGAHRRATSTPPLLSGPVPEVGAQR